MINELNSRDIYLDSLEAYVKNHPDVIPPHGGEIFIPQMLVNRGCEMTIRLTSYRSYNAALTVTHNCFHPDSDPEQIPLDFT